MVSQTNAQSLWFGCPYSNDRPTLSKRSPLTANATPPPSKAPAKRLKDDRPASAPLPLSPREQEVCQYLGQGTTFEAIAKRLGCSLSTVQEHYDRALAKVQRSPELALTPAPLEHCYSSAPSDRPATAQPKPAIAEQARSRIASALRERPSPLDLCVSSLFVTGIPVATGGVSFSQTTITDLPRHPRRRKCSSRRNRWAGVGDRLAAS
jgi:DNA-binding CsgD family transcriptional regulator